MRKILLYTTLIILFILMGINFSNAHIKLNKQTKGSSNFDNWPSFRGYRGSGIAHNQNLPLKWDGKTSQNILWKIPIPGLGHSSPVIWKDKLFITTAVGEKGDPRLKVGNYGSSPDNPEKFIHHFNVYCLSVKSGKIIWEKTAHKGIPKIQRHVKSSHANSSIATDGKYVIAFFGSEGLYCYDMKGKLLWKKDLGLLDAGAFDSPKIQWGFGSSPILYKGKVIVLCDVNNQSFMASFDAKNGNELWRTLRDETPTWGTPTIYEGKDQIQVIANGYKKIASYEVNTGKEIWWCKGGGDIPVPRPIISEDYVFLSNAHGKLRPIFVIDLKAKGNISLKDKETSNRYVVWYKPRRGSYIPTPIVYGKYLYVADDRGMLSCYGKKTGEEIYRLRITGDISPHSASPVIADGKLYITDEHGNTNIVKAGPKFKLEATNKLGESCLATPAISQQKIFIRTSKHIYAIGKK